MKRVLHIANIFLVVKSFIGPQFNYFSNLGYKHYVICNPSPFLSNYAKEMNFDYKTIKILRKINPINDFLSLILICRYIKKNNINIVVGHTPKGALLAMLASYIMKVPRRIYIRHGLVFETMKWPMRNLMINFDRLTAFCSTKVVCVSPSLAKKSLEQKLNPARKQMVLGKGTYIGIDVKKFNPENVIQTKLKIIRESLKINNNDFVIGYCGRLVRDKGIVELVEAFIYLQKIHPNKIKLLLVGNFEVRDMVPKNIQKEIQNNKDIILTGFIFDDIQYYYALMNLFVLPSYREGFGISVLEASAMKIPVLTTKATGCIDSIIEGYTGFYISTTKESIITGIKSMMNNIDAEKYGSNGRKFVLDYFDNRIFWPIIDKELYN